MQPQSSTRTTQRAAIYLRVSTLEQGEHGHSLDVQRLECRRLAEQLGVTVVAEFEDRDSGADWALPGLTALLDGAARGDFDLVLCQDPDRLSRRLARYVIIEQELRRRGVGLRFVTVRAGDTPEDRALQNMKAVFAELDYERIILRLTRGRRAKAEKGQYVGLGIPPYGYRPVRDGRGRTIGLAPDPATAPVVQRIFRAVQSHSLRAVCAALDQDGVPTYRGAPRWEAATLRQILNNPVYLGTAAYGRRDGAQRPRAPEHWVLVPVPPLIDRATWDAAHAALAERRIFQRRAPRTLADAFLLRGRLRCGHCGGALQTDTNRSYTYYVCGRHRRKGGRPREPGTPGCPLPQVPAPDLDALAWQVIADTLLNPDHLRAGLAAARAEWAAEEERRVALFRAIQEQRETLSRRIARLLDELVDAPAGSETAQLIRQRADELSRQIAALDAEAVRLDATPREGLSPRELDTLEAFAAEMQAGIAHADPADRRRLVDTLRLTATLTRVPPETPGAVRLGRFRYPIAITWQAVVPLPPAGAAGKKAGVDVPGIPGSRACGRDGTGTRQAGPEPGAARLAPLVPELRDSEEGSTNSKTPSSASCSVTIDSPMRMPYRMNSTWWQGKALPPVTAGSSTSRPQVSLPMSAGRNWAR